ncbi:MAG TPA: serine/threonine-protein kinase [Sphingomonas sp.]|jgi:serine/threonine-protein kinase
MTDPNGPPDDDDRTVFVPSGGQMPPPPASWGAPAARPPEERTAPPINQDDHTAPPSSQPTGGFQTAFAPRTDGQSIQVGDVLNHIFEVKRFLARGGMGEVFEGTNVNTEERVAIKVMLPALAADPNVIGMFRKEARTLTRLNHEALVSYRVLAQEPQLGVLYIVTEYIDGTNLADVLGTLKPEPAQLLRLLRRLASGLRTAHGLGAIHRDMSPDNVILEDGNLDKAKVIDFGIAKDLDPGSATIVGEGFAGKLNYVAPEQLGDFGREVGTWTDVYSLALVIMAVQLGKNVQMGGSLVDAVDKRRAGPDLSAMPDEIRPILDKMLKPNPADRLRTMDDVIAEVDAQGIGAPVPAPRSKVPMVAGIGAALIAVVAGGWVAMGGGREEAGKGGPGIVAVARDPVELARQAIDSTLPSVACTWLNIVKVDQADGRMTVALTGVAGNPSAAQNEVSRALQAQKINNATINFDEVAPITQSGCAALDAYRQVRAAEGRRLTVAQRSFELRVQPPESPIAGKKGANTIFTINIGDPTADFALVGLEPSGKITPLIESRAAFEAARKAGAILVTDLGSDRYRLDVIVDHLNWSGLMLVTGKGPFPNAVTAPPIGARGPDWRDNFVSTAANNGWNTDMVWFKTVDEVAE